MPRPPSTPGVPPWTGDPCLPRKEFQIVWWWSANSRQASVWLHTLGPQGFEEMAWDIRRHTAWPPRLSWPGPAPQTGSQGSWS